MLNAQVEYNVLLFSSDKELVDSVATSPDFAGDKSKISFQYTVRHDPANISYVEEFDVIIYDLDVVHNSVASAAFDLKRIKSNSSSNPIVLLGERTILDSVSVQGELTERVDRFISKPVFSAKLNLTLEVLLSKKVAGKEESQQTASQKKWLLIGGLMVFLILLAVAFYLFQSTKFQSNKTATQAVVNESVEIKSDSNEKVDQSLEVSRLINLAKEAEAAKRIYLPSGNNALHYYALALELDDYNNEAYQGRQQLIEQVRILLATKLVEEDLSEAETLLGVLEREEPFSDENRRTRQSLDALNSELSEQTPSVEPEIVATRTSSTATISATQTSNAASRTDSKTQPLASEEASTDWQLSEASDSGALDGAANQSERTTEIDKASRSAVDATSDQKTPISQVDKTILPASVNQKSASSNVSTLIPEKSKEVFKTPNEKLVTGQRANASSVIKPPKIINRVGAEYPPRAYKFDLEGWVEVSYQVSQEGLPINLSVINGEPKKIFNKAAIDALKQWRFEPAINESTGEPVVSETSSTKFNFAIDTFK